MKSFLNHPDTLLAESLAGFAATHADLVTLVADGNFIRRKHLARGKVAIISGGGSGHEPLHCGFVGQGMLDAACPGHLFTSPTPDQLAKTASAASGGAGIIFVVKNYAGDVMNFDMAADLLPGKVHQIIVSDDLATGPKKETRRGISGTLVVQKIVGAAAEHKMTVEQIFALGKQVNQSTRSIGVALEGSSNLLTKQKSFPLLDNHLEFGVGIHGEPGTHRINHKSANEMADDMCAAILSDIKEDLKKPALLLVNGLGGSSMSELYFMYYLARQKLETSGVTIVRSLVGNYVTSLNMAGCSITLTSMTEEMLRLWDAPVVTPSLRWGA